MNTIVRIRTSTNGNRLDVCPIVGPFMMKLPLICVHSGTSVGLPFLPTCIY
eukprot:COSAG02_NODE_6351_length_3630_cov_2.661852_1_plen_50_part_10